MLIFKECSNFFNLGDNENAPKLFGPECAFGGSGTSHTTTQKNLFVDFFPDSTLNSNELGFTLEVIAGKDLCKYL